MSTEHDTNNLNLENGDVNADDTEEAEKKRIDRQEKLQILIKHLKGYCNDQSEHDDLRKLGNGLKNGAKLTGKILTGGFTNYSFKIYLDYPDDNENHPDNNVAVFAKITFPYGLWCPAIPYDISRVTTEFELMKRFSAELKIATDSGGITKSPVPKPYELIDIPAAKDGASPNMKIFVAQWVAPTDEQWGNQFIKGKVDTRVIDQCARTLAMINLADCDAEINQGLCDSIEAIATGFDPLFLGVIERDVDRAVIYARDVLGKEKMTAIIRGWHICDRKKECLVHADAHVFNMLVERKPTFQLNSSFGPEGDFFLCDWEMAHMGQKGRDISNFLSFPVMSACFLAARGHKDKADKILHSLRQFWNTYKGQLAEGLQKKQSGSNSGDDIMDIEQYLTEVFHSAIACFGYVSFMTFYVLGSFLEYNETEGLTDEEQKMVMGVVGWIGLRSMEVGFLDASAHQAFGNHDSKRLARMESFFFGMLENEIKQLFVSCKGNQRPSQRQSSTLRESSRRVSDSDSGLGKIVRRLSQQAMIEELI